MKKFFLILCIIILCKFAYAHPPEKVILSFDQDTHSLTVEVIHPVSNPSAHYIYRIEILQNGKMVIDKEPPRQDATMLTEVYPLVDVNSGDLIKAIAFCNRGGEQSAQIEIVIA